MSVIGIICLLFQATLDEMVAKTTEMEDILIRPTSYSFFPILQSINNYSVYKTKQTFSKLNNTFVFKIVNCSLKSVKSVGFKATAEVFDSHTWWSIH